MIINNDIIPLMQTVYFRWTHVILTDTIMMLHSAEPYRYIYFRALDMLFFH